MIPNEALINKLCAAWCKCLHTTTAPTPTVREAILAICSVIPESEPPTEEEVQSSIKFWRSYQEDEESSIGPTLKNFTKRRADKIKALEAELTALKAEPRFTLEQISAALESQGIELEVGDSIMQHLSPKPKTPEDRVVIEVIERGHCTEKRLFRDGCEVKKEDLLEYARLHLLDQLRQQEAAND